MLKRKFAEGCGGTPGSLPAPTSTTLEITAEKKAEGFTEAPRIAQKKLCWQLNALNRCIRKYPKITDIKGSSLKKFIFICYHQEVIAHLYDEMAEYFEYCHINIF